MLDRKLKKSFQTAVEYVRLHDDVAIILQNNFSAFGKAVNELNENFPAFYAAAENNKTKKALIKTLTDFVVRIAERPPVDGAMVAEHAAAVQALCNTLNKTVQDKSLIPAYFPAQLLDAAYKMFSAVYEDEKGRGNAYAESKKISTAAYQFFAPTTQRQAKAKL